MINSKRLVAIAKKWRKLAVVGRRRISMSRDVLAVKEAVPSKGHFTVYTSDGRRFRVPLAYHNNPIFQELFKMSEDEYGLPSNGPIKMPCDAVFMDYLVSLLRRVMPKDVESALIESLASGRCSTSSCLHHIQANQPMFVQGY